MDDGERGMMGFGAMQSLNLAPDQRSKLNKIQNEARKQQWALMGRVLDERAKLYDLYAADRPDPKKIGPVYGAIFDIRRQMIETQIDAMNRAKDILNKEQLEKLKQLQQGGGSAAGGMPHGMMHEMMEGHGSKTMR
jgi:Spy/CpxP family protein refolding chaperone